MIRDVEPIAGFCRCNNIEGKMHDLIYRFAQPDTPEGVVSLTSNTVLLLVSIAARIVVHLAARR